MTNPVQGVPNKVASECTVFFIYSGSDINIAVQAYKAKSPCHNILNYQQN